MAKLIIIFGPQAVGKMTVGQELEKITDLKLFHNHMTIDLVSEFFEYGTKQAKRLVKLFRNEIFEEVSKSDIEWLIFTYVCRFDQKLNIEYIDYICDIFESKWWKSYLIELEADQKVRLERNKHPHRLFHKPNKKDIQKSENCLKEYDEKFRLNSFNWEIKKENYIRIDNTNLSPEKVAEKIKEKFKL